MLNFLKKPWTPFVRLSLVVLTVILVFSSFLFFPHFFQMDAFMPRAFCMNGDPALIRWYALNNILIALAYLLIPLFLLGIFREIKWGLLYRYRHLFVMFMAFIVSCSIGHILNVIMLWYPIYYFAIFWDGVTGFVSLITCAFMLPALIDIKNQYLTTKKDGQL